ncbi:membrane protein [Longimycelium tulufanense]|uniref:Membrane protein n=1 Tax=Longimycelium tulufanense TaxID=907463 RepID=A0A8J3CHU4_9PSEU|nr:glycosyltransferase 87 family protein [Longimycelium tulufanense]GGM68968.1 membrane protein [Longimycelium tulufanense]
MAGFVDPPPALPVLGDSTVLDPTTAGYRDNTAARMRALLSARVTLLVGISVTAIVAWVLYRVTSDLHIDLEVYRAGVLAWWHGGDPYGSLPATRSGAHLPFIYPPFAALALGPFVVLPWSAAVAALIATSLVALGGTLYLVARRLWPAGGTVGALTATSVALPLALVLEPTFETFRFGQVNIVLMALVAADCLVVSPRWPRGLLVGIAAAIKLTPAAFLLFFVLRRDFRAAITAVVSGAVATVLGFAVAPAASMRFWFGGMPTSGISGSPFHTNQSIQGTLARLEFPPVLLEACWLVATLALVLLAAVLIRRVEATLAVVVNAAVGLLVSPTSWSHHWVWIAPTLLVLTAYALRLRSIGWALAAMVLAVVFLVAPHRFLPGGDRRELGWNAAEHLIGNSYVLVTIVALVVLLGAARARGRCTPTSPATPPTESSRQLTEVGAP